MDVNIRWMEPAVPVIQQGSVEKHVIASIQASGFLDVEAQHILVSFLPDVHPNCSFLATIEELPSGKLLGVIVSPRNSLRFTVTKAT